MICPTIRIVVPDNETDWNGNEERRVCECQRTFLRTWFSENGSSFPFQSVSLSRTAIRMFGLRKYVAIVRVVGNLLQSGESYTPNCCEVTATSFCDTHRGQVLYLRHFLRRHFNKKTKAGRLDPLNRFYMVGQAIYLYLPDNQSIYTR
jgi:hypothetical protein